MQTPAKQHRKTEKAADLAEVCRLLEKIIAQQDALRLELSLARQQPLDRTLVRRDELMPLIVDAIKRDRDGVCTEIAQHLRR